MGINLDAFDSQSLEDKKEQLEIGVRSAMSVMYYDFLELCDELTDYGYESELFTKIANIKNFAKYLIDQIEDLERQIAEEQEEE